MDNTQSNHVRNSWYGTRSLSPLFFGYMRAKASEPNALIQGSDRALPVVLTVTEAYQVLRISRWLLYEKYIHTGKLRTIKIGHRRVVPLSAIEELLERSSQEEAS